MFRRTPRWLLVLAVLGLPLQGIAHAALCGAMPAPAAFGTLSSAPCHDDVPDAPQTCLACVVGHACSPGAITGLSAAVTRVAAGDLVTATADALRLDLDRRPNHIDRPPKSSHR